MRRIHLLTRRDLDRLIAVFYRELVRVAKACLRGKPSSDDALQTSASLEADSWLQGRVSRQVLADDARAPEADRAGARVRVSFVWRPDLPHERKRIVAALDNALRALARENETSALIIELRLFGGFTPGEIGGLTGLPPQDVRRRLRAAQAWLRREIEREARSAGFP
jgi:hypothetical protein